MEPRPPETRSGWIDVDPFERSHPRLVFEQTGDPGTEFPAHSTDQDTSTCHDMKSSSHRSFSSLPARPRRAGRITVVLAGLIAIATGGGVLAHGDGGVDRPAEVGAPAIRVGADEASPPESDEPAGPAEPVEGLYLYPVETQPRCENLDNFGGFSKSFGSGGHQGVDIGTERGQEVYAVVDGVLYRQWTDLDGGAGLGWGLHGVDDTKFRYFHLDGFAPGLEVGSTVERGQVIGYVGDTGNATPGGWHLHFEIRPGPAPHATPVDPNPLLDIPDDCVVYWR